MIPSQHKVPGLLETTHDTIVNADIEDDDGQTVQLLNPWPQGADPLEINQRALRPRAMTLTPSHRRQIPSQIFPLGVRSPEAKDEYALLLPNLLCASLQHRSDPVPDTTDHENNGNVGHIPLPLDDAYLYRQISDPQNPITPSGPSPTFFRKFFESPPLTGTSESFLLLDTSPKRRHPFAKGYEEPQWKLFIIHVMLCALTYPFLLVFVIAAVGKSIFLARFLIGAGCGLVGVGLGMSLLNLSRAILEAAAWATIIHQSQTPNGPGIKLKDLAIHSGDPSGARGAFQLLWDRLSYQGARRGVRKSYDDRRWSLWIVFFLLNIFLAAMLSFLLGRAVNIICHVVSQHQNYHEVAVAADISDVDIQRINSTIQSSLKNFPSAWTLPPPLTHGSFPSAVALSWNNDTAFFSEVIPSQLIPGGNGFGTLEPDTATLLLDISDRNIDEEDSSMSAPVGAVLRELIPLRRVYVLSTVLVPFLCFRFPRWGIRIKCTKIPSIPNNLVPVSYNGSTYLFTPRETVRYLFEYFDLSLPEPYEMPFNFTSFVNLNDTLPSGLDKLGTALGTAFPDDGFAYSLNSRSFNLGQNGEGFIALAHVLVRLNDTYAPNGIFGVKGAQVPDINGSLTAIGYDAVACLELYEPWVLEVYNSSVSAPRSTRIVDKAASIKDMNTQFTREHQNGKRISNPVVKRVLNSTDLSPVYYIGHTNGEYQILKDSRRNADYVSSPTLISFTDGQGCLGYTELSDVYFAQALALADASNILPYFAGSVLTVARQYPDKIVINSKIANVRLAMILTTVCVMGGISAFFVPRLPLNMPRRGFDLYSWFSAFFAQELVVDRPGLPGKHLELREIVEYAGEKKIYYAH